MHNAMEWFHNLPPLAKVAVIGVPIGIILLFVLKAKGNGTATDVLSVPLADAAQGVPLTAANSTPGLAGGAGNAAESSGAGTNAAAAPQFVFVPSPSEQPASTINLSFTTPTAGDTPTTTGQTPAVSTPGKAPGTKTGPVKTSSGPVVQVHQTAVKTAGVASPKAQAFAQHKLNPAAQTALDRVFAKPHAASTGAKAAPKAGTSHPPVTAQKPKAPQPQQKKNTPAPHPANTSSHATGPISTAHSIIHPAVTNHLPKPTPARTTKAVKPPTHPNLRRAV